MKYRPTVASRRIASFVDRKRISIIQGGQGAGKTISILMWLIEFCLLNPNSEVSIISEELSKMKRTVVRDFLSILMDWGLFSANMWNKSSNVFNFPNRSYIEFLGLDKFDIGKGMRRHVVFFNEANKVTFLAYQQVASRAGKVILDFNPDSEFWVHTELTEKEKLILDFGSNEFLSDTERSEILDYKRKGFLNPDLENYDIPENIKNEFWANKWRVYGLGKIGVTEGTVFKVVNYVDKFPDGCKRVGYGLDFGYENDPTALIKCGMKFGELFFQEVIYDTKIHTNRLIKLMEYYKIKKTSPIIADPAGSDAIAILKSKGWKVIKAKKGRGSILSGIELLQNYTLNITNDSENLKFEQKNYKYRKTRDKIVSNIPEDRHNHGFDAIRYWASVALVTKVRRNRSKAIKLDL